VDFCTTSGIIHVAQPEATTQRLSHAVASLDAFHLAGLSPLVTIGGSLVAALAVLEGHIAPADAWTRARLFYLHLLGEHALAFEEQRLPERLAEAERVLALLTASP